MVWVSGEREFELATQLNFFDIVENQEKQTKTIFCRSRRNFWEEDILPTANLIRYFYFREGYRREDADFFEDAWQWLKISEYAELLRKYEDLSEVDRKAIPLQVLLNFSASRFFISKDIFTVPQGSKWFSPFVAYAPGSNDIKVDISNILGLKIQNFRERPLEYNAKAINSERVSNEVFEARVLPIKDLDRDLLDWFEGVDTITEQLLFKYHMELLRREQKIFLQHRLNTRYK